MISLRDARKRLTAGVMRAAYRAAPALPSRAIDALQRGLSRYGWRLPVLSRIVASNMRAAGVYDETVLRAYFDQIALHLANGVRIFRSAQQPEVISQLARDQIELDASVAALGRQLGSGQGMVIAPAHMCNYLLALVRLNERMPVCVYLRWSPDRQRIEMKRTWCRAGGLQVILEPASASDPTSRAMACVEAVRNGAALLMTPDLVQKPSAGVEVDLLGRRMYLPTGPASIAMLAEVPLVPLFGRRVEGKQMLTVREPLRVQSFTRADGGRRAGIRQAMQTWADHFDDFVRHCPELWFFWGDKRWTRVFQNDPRYTSALVDPVTDCDKETA